MGDMSDYMFDQWFQMDDGLYDYGGILECRYCGAQNLHWGNTGTKRKPAWRLHDVDGIIHACDKYKPKGNSYEWDEGIPP